MPYALCAMRTRGPMLKNIFKIAFRDLLRQKAFALINIAGLATGIAACLLIVLFVRDEMSYEKFHPSADRIVRITYKFNNLQQGTAITNASSPNIVASWLKQNFTDVLQTTRLFRPYPRETYVSYGDKVFLETGQIFADSSFFDVFDGYRVLRGSLNEALFVPNSVIISGKIAEKYFGSEDPVGKYLTINNRTQWEVTAVLEEPAGKSHLVFDFVASDLGIASASNLIWDNPNYYTYALLSDSVSLWALEKSMNETLDSEVVSLGIQSLRDIHLNSRYVGELQPNSNVQHLFAFSFIALLILGIACTNYINLSTARSAERAKEVGMLKVLGVNRVSLFWKFLLEVVIEIVPALVLAVLMVQGSLPLFNQMMNKAVAITDIPFVTLLALFGLFLVLVSLSAGAYPAIVLSGLKPAEAVKGKFRGSRHGVRLRKILVVAQFSVSIFLIAGAIVLYRQMNFVQEKSLGYDKEHIVIAKLDRRGFSDRIDLLRNEFLTHPKVVDVGASAVSPVAVPRAGAGVQIKSIVDEARFVSVLAANRHFLATLGLPLIAGSNFTRDHTPGQERQFIVNETFVQRLNLSPEQALGTRVRVLFFGDDGGTIVGVVKNFHARSLHDDIEPLLIYQNPIGYSRLLVRLQPGNPQPVLQELEKIWKKIAPEYPFVYEFLDSEYDALYRQEQRAGGMIQIFTGLAILVACFGLYGLSSYSTIQRTKEIGVRKVLGATISSIVSMLSSEVLRLILVAFVLSVPFTFYFADKWLDDFAYRIALDWWIFGLAGLVAMLMALVTSIQQSIRAALTNPVQNLRYE